MGAVYDEFVQELDGWSRKYAGKPSREMLRLLFLSLEREELVSINYREDLILQRLQTMPVAPEVRKLIHHALVWAWKDEQMHTIYLRGAILRLGNFPLRARAFARQMMGATGGWAGSVRQHVRWKQAPLSHTLASLLTLGGQLTGHIPRDVREYLRFRPFRDFCLFNVDAEKTAWLCYNRMLEILPLLPDTTLQHQEDLCRIQADETNHERIFALIAAALDENDRLVPEETPATLSEKIAAVGEFFLPRSQRETFAAANPVGSGGRVWVREGTTPEEKLPLFRDLLTETRILEQLEDRARLLGKPVSNLHIVIKPSFMLGYSHKDRSILTDSDLIEALAQTLREQTGADIAVVETPNLYDHYYSHRSVAEVAAYFGIHSPYYRLVDLSRDQVSHTYMRGMAQYSIGRTWKEADFRIVFGKMRSHPTEFVYLTVGSLDGLGARCEEFLFPDRQAHRDSAIMMLMSDFPPHFALLDAYDQAADGMLGMMGCPHPPAPRRLYAGTDPLALDMVAAVHMGLSEPRRCRMLNTACQWFGDPSTTIEVDGINTPLPSWRGPYQNEWTSLLSLFALPVYEYASGRGALFVPEMDMQAFPPLQPESRRLRWTRHGIQAFLGLRHRS